MKVVIRDYLTNEIACIFSDEETEYDIFGDEVRINTVDTFGNFEAIEYDDCSNPLYKLYDTGRAILEENKFMLDLSKDGDNNENYNK